MRGWDGAKETNTRAEKKAEGWGDIWTWIAIDVETKLVPCWFIGQRHAGAAYHFMHDLKSRLAHRVQLTIDAHRAYLTAVEDAFSWEIGLRTACESLWRCNRGRRSALQPRNLHGNEVCSNQWLSRFQPRFHVIRRAPEFDDANVNAPVHKTNQRSLEKGLNHAHAIAIHYMHYNFARIHQSLRVTPAMEAGISDQLWSNEEIIGLLDSN